MRLPRIPQGVVAAFAAVALVAAGSAAGLAATTDDTSATTAAPSCATTVDGANFHQDCVIPRETVAVPGPTVTAVAPAVGLDAASASAFPRLLFVDDFTGTAVDLARWNVRNNSWANNELSIDTSRPRNVFLSGGVLTLRAQRESYTVGSTTRQFTSGYLDTIDRFSVGPPFRVDARLKLPAAKGLWPALWLRGDSTLGEVDILEAVGGWAKAALTVHQSTYGDMAKLGYEWSPPVGWSWADWHVYGFEWDADGSMRWYVDGRLVLTRTTGSVDSKGQPATWLTGPTFASPFHLRLNLQVGGSMPNYYKLPVDSTTPFPADFAADYVTVRGTW